MSDYITQSMGNWILRACLRFYFLGRESNYILLVKHSSSRKFAILQFLGRTTWVVEPTEHSLASRSHTAILNPLGWPKSCQIILIVIDVDIWSLVHWQLPELNIFSLFMFVLDSFVPSLSSEHHLPVGILTENFFSLSLLDPFPFCYICN